jgi:hypothetical protein
MEDLDQIEEWATVDEDDPGVRKIPSLTEMNLETVSRMLSALRRLYRQLAEYDQLHVAEQRRIDEQHARVVKPIVRRVEDLEASLHQFAVKAYLDENRTRIATPNGIISSSKTKPLLDFGDGAGDWLHELAPQTVEYVPKIDKTHARQLLDHLVDSGVLERVIVGAVTPEGLDITVVTELPKQRMTEPGRFRVVKTGELVPGITWSTSGEHGVGRNFRVDAS